MSGTSLASHAHGTDVYVTRTHGGVGGGHREVSPYPIEAV